jgi:hypothetical protein
MDVENVISQRHTARIVGILFIIGTVAGVSSFIGLQPQNTPNFLVTISENAFQVRLGSLAVMVMGIAIAPIPVFLYPILRKQNESLAMGYIVFRTLEVVTYILISVSWLMLLSISQNYVAAGMPDMDYYYTLGSLVKEVSNGVDPILVVIFSISALIVNHLFYKSKLIPRWLSGWGLIGGTLHLFEGLMNLLGYPITSIPIYLPIAIQEMVYAVWLIIKGFNQDAIPMEINVEKK